MFLESHGSLSPVQFISRCVSSVRVQANGTTWSIQKGCLPTRQPLLRVCSGACSSLCHSGSQVGGKNDSVLRTDPDPEDSGWTLPWDVPAASPHRILTQVGMSPLVSGWIVGRAEAESLCVVSRRKASMAQPAVEAGQSPRSLGPGALSSMQSAAIDTSGTACARPIGSGL